MKRSFYFLILFALLAFFACEKEEEYPVQIEVSEGESVYSFKPGFKVGQGSVPDYVPVFTQNGKIGIFDEFSGRVKEFVITKVPSGTAGERALAYGALSEGKFITKAIYPADAVKTWSTVSEYTLEVPVVQTISGDVPFDPNALVFAADVTAAKKEIDFSSIVSLVKFRVADAGVKSVSFSFKDAEGKVMEQCEVKSGSGAFATGKDYYAVVSPGKYSSLRVSLESGGGKKSGCSFADGFAFAPGDASCDLGELIGLADVGYSKIIEQKNYANLVEYLKGVRILNRQQSGLYDIAMSYISLMIPAAKAVQTYSYEYESVGPDGNPVTLSAALVLPESAVTRKTPIKKVILANHFSEMTDMECPTSSPNIEGLLAWKDVAVVLPDYYGFGSSSEFCQAYLNPDVSGRGSLDALLAARKLLDDKGIEYPDNTLNIGYSQGGFNAIANLRYMSLHPDYNVRFEHTFAGGGPYDVYSTFTGFYGGGFDNVYPLILVFLTSSNELERLNVDYSEMFTEPLLSNYERLILSKEYDTLEVPMELAALGVTDLRSTLTAAIVDTSSEVFNKFKVVADRFSLYKGWTPLSGTKITLVHSKDDDMVPYDNFVSLEAFLNGKCSLETKTYTGTGHVFSYINFLLSVLEYL